MLHRILFAGAALLAVGAPLAMAQGGDKKGPPPPMSFFVTGTPKGDGANYGGLAGADQYCQLKGSSVNAPGTWHAYLSTQGPGAVNARDRIGNGPWYNAKGQPIAKNLSDLHGDTLEQALVGNTVSKATVLDE